MNSTKLLVATIVFLTGLIYIASIVWAGFASLYKMDFQPVFSDAIVLIGGILSTNLGAVIGVTVAPPQPNAKALQPSYLKLKSSFTPSVAGQLTNKIDKSQKLQIIGCWVYILSLVAALILLIVNFVCRVETPLPILEELSRSLLGVMCGVLAVRLGA